MMTNLGRLFEVMPPPEEPLEVPTLGDWERCECEISPLPLDYRAFISAYGTGTVDDFLWVFNPASGNEFLNLVSQRRAILSALAITARQSPARFSMPRFPEPGGFLPFAGTDNGDSLFWVTAGEPDAWTVAVMGPRAPDVYRYEGGLVAFLVAIIAEGFDCGGFPDDFPSGRKVDFAARLG